MNSTKEKFKIRLGLFVIGGAVLFIVAIFIIGKQQNLFNSVFKLRTTFYNVSGLQVGNNVRFSGINVGMVDQIRILNDSTVEVGMLLKKDVLEHIKVDADVSIGTDGLIGDRILLISQGSQVGSPVQNNQCLTSIEPVETDEIIASLEVTALNLEIISGEFANVMRNINSGKGTIGRLIQDSAIANSVTDIIDNLESSSKGLDENMEAAKSNIFLRGYFNRKKRDKRKKEEAEAERLEELKKNK